MRKEITLSYIAGYIDGEGSIDIGKYKDRENPRFRIRVSNTHLETLELLKEFFGLGGIYKMRLSPNGKKKYYQWSVSARLDVVFILKKIIPYLIEKKERAKKVLQEAESRNYMRHVIRNYE